MDVAGGMAQVILGVVRLWVIAGWVGWVGAARARVRAGLGLGLGLGGLVGIAWRYCQVSYKMFWRGGGGCQIIRTYKLYPV